MECYIDQAIMKEKVILLILREIQSLGMINCNKTLRELKERKMDRGLKKSTKEGSLMN